MLRLDFQSGCEVKMMAPPSCMTLYTPSATDSISGFLLVIQNERMVECVCANISYRLTLPIVGPLKAMLCREIGGRAIDRTVLGFSAGTGGTGVPHHLLPRQSAGQFIK